MRKRYLILISCLAFAFIAGCNAVQQPTSVNLPDVFRVSAKQQKWEYKTLVIEKHTYSPFTKDPACEAGTCISESETYDTLEKLNALGAEGWELVNFVHTPGEAHAVFIFKRPLE